jgi:hypothetical protein
MTFTLRSQTETVVFAADQIDQEESNFGFVSILRFPATGWAGNYMPKTYMVRDARRIYGELLAKGYKAA